MPWLEFLNHIGDTLSKPLVHPDTTGSSLIDYRISAYQPNAYAKTHSHRVQKQVYHVLEGEGMTEIDGERTVIRKHDVVFLLPGTHHAIYNTGLVDLTLIVATTLTKDS